MRQDAILDRLFACIARTEQIFEKLGHRLADSYRFHTGRGVQIFIYSDSIEDIEMGLTDFGAETGCTTEHLLKQNTAVDLAHEHKITNCRHVNTGS